MTNSTIAITLAALSGISFSLIGVSFRFAENRSIHTLLISLLSSLAGLIFYSVRAVLVTQGTLPLLVILCGLAAGISQYAVIYLVKLALERGSLSALWSSMMLGFIPLTLVAVLFMGEPFKLMYIPMILAAGVAIFMAVANTPRVIVEVENGDLPPAQSNSASQIIYVVLLVAVLVLNSLANMVMKYLSFQSAGDGLSLLDHYKDGYLAIMYGGVFLCILIDVLVARRKFPALVPWLPLGMLAAVGSIGGLWMLAQSVSLPAAQVFTVNSVVSILAAATWGALIFKEKRTRFWYGTILFCILSVIFSGLAG